MIESTRLVRELARDSADSGATFVNYKVLDINGQAPPAVDANGLEETVVVPSRGTATIVARFHDYLGTFVFHCHILEHEDQGFMTNFQVVP